MKQHKMYVRYAVALGTLLFAAGCASEKNPRGRGTQPNKASAERTAEAGSVEAVSFTAQVRPILSDRCFACHGPDADNQESPFRLDSQEASRMNLAKAGEAPRYGVVPGKPEASLMLARITHEDPSQRMPPPEAKKKEITPGEVAILRQWIRDGAKYEKHWAFVPPVKHEPPAVKNAGWARNNIDAFILARLEAENIQPSPEAGKETLIRRVYMDLLGLPPRPEDIDVFIADESSAAYEKMVDRAFASSHYGERMAIDWLDTARYADTNAIHVDMMRTSWPWRDWVIRAFNNNMPYREFIIEQLAGDLLPNPTLQQKVATSFNRNHGITNEGGVIAEEFLVEYAVDRVSTMGAAFMGLTLGCARCHDHKFDPITQDDFYSFVSFFNNIPEKGLEAQNEDRALAYPPFVTVYTEDQEQMLASANKVLDEFNALKNLKGEEALPAVGDEQAVSWEALTLVNAHSDKKKLPALLVVKDQKALGKNGNNKISQVADTQKIVFRADLGADAVLQLNFKAPAAPFNAIRVEAEPASPGSLFDDDPQNNENMITEIEAALYTGTATQALEIVKGVTSLAPPGDHIAAALDRDAASAWNLGLPGIDHHFFLQLKEPVTAAQGEIGIRIHFQGRPHRDKFFQDLTVYTGNNPHGYDEPPALIPAKARLGWHREALLVNRYNQAGKTMLRPADLFHAQRQKAHLDKNATRCMVMEENKSIKPTYVLNRGVYDQPLKDRPRERVTPAAFGPLPEGAPPNRLGLAQWLVSDTHPLTARFAVNRFWQQLFQHGIVKSSDDFGLQSDPPSHPLLLDYLAVDFREHNWDVKRLMKMLVMSATYRQASTYREDLEEIDPENRLLARAPRYRLPAEVIRDNGLAASGLLNDTVGGPSVKPYQPAGLWREKTMRPNMNTGTFIRDSGEKLYRRGMYTFWKQASPPPQLELFDAPSREACVVKRRITNTPMQALVLMNDEAYLEIARELATRLFKEMQGAWPDQLSARVEQGLRLTTGRKPDPRELERWISFTNENLDRFAAKPGDAESFLSYGEKPKDTSIPEIELAALTFSMSAALNLDETITRD